MKSIEEKLGDIKLLAMDFDGVLTDNKVFIDENGKEMTDIKKRLTAMSAASG